MSQREQLFNCIGYGPYDVLTGESIGSYVDTNQNPGSWYYYGRDHRLHDRACMNLVLLYESLLLCEPVVSGDPNSDAVTIGMPDNDLCIEYQGDQEDIDYGDGARE